MIDAVKGSVKEVKDEQGSLTATGAKASFYLVPQATDGISFTLTLGGETKHFTLDALFKQSGNPQAALESGKSCTLTLKWAVTVLPYPVAVSEPGKIRLQPMERS